MSQEESIANVEFQNRIDTELELYSLKHGHHRIKLIIAEQVQATVPLCVEVSKKLPEFDLVVVILVDSFDQHCVTLRGPLPSRFCT